jgi:PAS domain-containing protein
VNPSASRDIPISPAVVIGRNGIIVGWNEGAESILGFAATDVVGRASHHVLCGRDPSGRLVCHPYCAWSPADGRLDPDDELVLYPRSAGHVVVRITLSLFRIEATDATRGWAVHLITSAEPVPMRRLSEGIVALPWRPRRGKKAPRPPDVDRH